MSVSYNFKNLVCLCFCFHIVHPSQCLCFMPNKATLSHKRCKGIISLLKLASFSSYKHHKPVNTTVPRHHTFIPATEASKMD